MNTSQIRCLYVYDHKFKIHNNSVYSEGKITDEVFSRYTLPTEPIFVISRIENIDDPSGLSKISLDNIHFKPVQGLFFSKIFSSHLLYNVKLIFKSIQEVDFIVVRMPSFLGIFALSLNLLIRKKYFVEVVGNAEEALLTSKSSVSTLFRLFTFIIDSLNKYHIKHADGVIYVTKSALQKKYPTLGFSGYASNVEVTVKNKNLKLDDYQVGGEYFKVGLIGSFNNHYKGINEAIDAIAALKRKGYKVRLHILGSGTLESYYKSKAKNLAVEDNISFDGVLEGGKDVINWLESLNLYIQPSYSEGLPRALIEAMSVGLPVVATNVGGIPELIEEQKLIKPYDSKSLALKIENFMESQTLRFNNGYESYEKAKSYDKNVLEKRRADFWKKARGYVSSNNLN